jgi:hypothetical protein
LSDELIDQRVEVRQIRSAILTRENPPEFQAVIDEAALHRVIGSPATMCAALEHVIQVCDLPNVSIQVLSYEAGAHPALDSTFALLEFRDPIPAVVYVEGLVGQVWFERHQDTERFKLVFERLQAMALMQQESVNLMAKLADAFKRY